MYSSDQSPAIRDRPTQQCHLICVSQLMVVKESVTAQNGGDVWVSGAGC